jgi:hypothetical protein
MAENPVAMEDARQTGDFGRQPRDRRNTPSPTTTGGYGVFSSIKGAEACEQTQMPLD